MNIGLANQFARFADANSIDIYSVIEACNSQPFSHIHQPGIAVGGHCIPIYPRMYLLGDPDASVVRAAREANLEMPAYAAARLEETHGSLTGESVVVLGATYRGGVKETAFSGVFPLVAALESRGATVFVHDPMLTSDEIRDLGFTPYSQVLQRTQRSSKRTTRNIRRSKARTFQTFGRFLTVVASSTPIGGRGSTWCIGEP